jgi:hypothetical protein
VNEPVDFTYVGEAEGHPTWETTLHGYKAFVRLIGGKRYRIELYDPEGKEVTRWEVRKTAPPNATPNAIPPTNGLGGTGLICGLASVLGVLLVERVFVVLVFIFAVMAICFGAAGLSQRHLHKGTSIAGVVLGTIGVLLSIVVVVTAIY